MEVSRGGWALAGVGSCFGSAGRSLLLVVVALVASSRLIYGSNGSHVLGPEDYDEHFRRMYHFTDTWAVAINGNDAVAATLARKHGFIYLGQIIPGWYHFRHRRLARRSAHYNPLPKRTLANEPQVLAIQQQVARKRVKRGSPHDPSASPAPHFSDPKWPFMWYLNMNNKGRDMNIPQAWAMNFTGEGVVVSILDDGIESQHPDLRQNYDQFASFDVNGNDNDPSPRYEPQNENKHGTRCAGVVAAMANNQVCNLGVAFNARIGGIRMLDGDVTDAIEARSLSFRSDYIHIYSASWGPDDDGRTVDGPGQLTKHAFENGIRSGRRGLGSIFVWASGNGGRKFDSCNCDGYTNSIYTVSVSSVTEGWEVPWYSEPCSSTLATTYSSGASGQRQIITTDLRYSCTDNHTGTSASAPLAAGMIALTLEANPNLTWRDLQHVIVLSSRRLQLKANDWVLNGINRWVSHDFGFGMMDARRMIELATNWTRVPKQRKCVHVVADVHDAEIRTRGHSSFVEVTSACASQPQQRVRYLEHVQARITLTSTNRGQVEIALISPSNTLSTLLPKRKFDNSHDGFTSWDFMTTHCWGEHPAGRWQLIIKNGAENTVLRSWTLIMYGTDVEPHPYYNQTSADVSSSDNHVPAFRNPRRPRDSSHRQTTVRRGDRADGQSFASAAGRTTDCRLISIALALLVCAAVQLVNLSRLPHR